MLCHLCSDQSPPVFLDPPLFGDRPQLVGRLRSGLGAYPLGRGRERERGLRQYGQRRFGGSSRYPLYRPLYGRRFGLFVDRPGLSRSPHLWSFGFGDGLTLPLTGLLARPLAPPAAAGAVDGELKTIFGLPLNLN